MNPTQFSPPRQIEIPPAGRWQVRWQGRKPDRLLAVSLALGIVTAIGVLVRWQGTPTVDYSTVTIEPVHRGPLDNSVLGQGELRSSEVYAVSAPLGGVVQRMHVLPGARLSAGEPLITLRNADMDQQLLDAQAAMISEESRHAALAYDLTGRELSQDKELIELQASVTADQLELEAMQKLLKSETISRLQYERQRLRTEAAENQLLGLRQRQAKFQGLLQRSLQSSEAVLQQRRRILENVQRQAAGLVLQAQAGGVLLKLSEEVREGQAIKPGQFVAEIARSTQLEAEVRVAASRAGDIDVGNAVRVQANRGVVRGLVSRIDPEAAAAQVAVIVALQGAVPGEFRPGLPVSVEISAGEPQPTLYVRKPLHARPNSEGYLFVREGDVLVRRPVVFGRSSTEWIEIKAGLVQGAAIAVSGVDGFSEVPRLRLSGTPAPGS